MSSDAISNARTFAIMGHTGSGKTTLTDALLYSLGQNDRLGSVDAGSSMADCTDEEKSRKTTIFSKPFAGRRKRSDGVEERFVFIDTPGYMDFCGQVVAASRAVESALIAVDAAAGVQVGTRQAWRTCDRQGLARGLIVTGLDRDNTDFFKTLSEIRAAFGNHCVPVMLPTPDGEVADVIGARNIPEALRERAVETRSNLIELAAETDDSLIEKFLGGEELSPDEMAAGMKSAVASGRLAPVFVCFPLKGKGIGELLDAVFRLFPSPFELQARARDGEAIAAGDDQPFAGLVWKTVNDPFVGQLAFVRVMAGTLQSDSDVQNAVRNVRERIGTLLLVNGRKQEPVSNAVPGDIVAVPKLKNSSIGDTLREAGSRVVCAAIDFPSPVMLQAIRAKTQADEDKIGVALSRVCEEDPTLNVERNVETRETVLKGMGDVHLEVALGLMKSRSNVEAVMDTPKVPYRETVTATGEGHYKHKKQSGGRGQYGEVYLRVEPKPPDEEEWFVDAVVGGVIPGNFIPAVQKGLVEGMQTGAIAGYPVTNVKVTVYDGSYHDVDSSEIAFKIAGARAFRDAMTNAKPVLLEPIMTVKVFVPEQFMGDINGDLNHKRGRILGMGSEDGLQVITADVPQAELFRYAAELRSMTGGQGTFTMEFSRYEIVPQNVAQKVIAASERKKEED